MKNIIFTIGFVFSVAFANAQSFVDNALLFSRTKAGGSARVQALGGTQISLGGDYSSALSNPAGLGMFNRSEFTFSAALSSQNSSSEYFGTTNDESKTVFNIPGFSLAWHFPSQNESGYLGGTLGVSLTRINDLNLDTRFSGTNTENSIVDYFLEDAGSTDPDFFLDDSYNDFYSLTGMAYRNYLIEDLEDGNGDLYYGTVLNLNQKRQDEISERRGAQYQWSFAYGANIDDKLFLGATLGVTSLRFKLSQVYREYQYEYSDNITKLDDLAIRETYDISGSGVNFTIGGIYRPLNFLQVGFSFVTPTRYQIIDNYTARFETNWNNFDYYGDGSEILSNIYEEFEVPLVSEYSLTTPSKVSGGLTLISKYGFISADIETMNFKRAKYSSDIADDFGPENDGIKAEYSRAINYRVGAEYRYEKFRVRAGFNFMDDPVKASTVRLSQNAYSAGLGYRDKTFYIDFAATYSRYKGIRVPYFTSGSVDPVANQKFSSTNYVITVGFPF